MLRDERLGVARLELEHDGYAWRAGAPKHRRVMSLSPSCLEVHDRIVGGSDIHSGVSRLRLDASTSVRVTGDGEVSRRDGAWHAQLGVPQDAVVLEQNVPPDHDEGVRWRLEW